MKATWLCKTSEALSHMSNALIVMAHKPALSAKSHQHNLQKEQVKRQTDPKWYALVLIVQFDTNFPLSPGRPSEPSTACNRNMGSGQPRAVQQTEPSWCPVLLISKTMVQYSPISTEILSFISTKFNIEIHATCFFHFFYSKSKISTPRSCLIVLLTQPVQALCSLKPGVM